MSAAKKVSWAEIRLWRIGLLVPFLALWEAATRRGWIDQFFVSQAGRGPAESDDRQGAKDAKVDAEEGLARLAP